jgi:thiol-disulfide isomerase/thioredoxin
MEKYRIIIAISFLTFLISCATVPKEEKIVITGKFSWTEWKNKSGWEHFTADEYNPGQFLTEQIGEISKSSNIKYLIFSGSWCGDSKTEVPKLFKLFENARKNSEQIELMGVDREKREPSGIAEQFLIEKVPTLVILKNNSELGRIVEFPTTSWEEDIFKILLTDK